MSKKTYTLAAAFKQSSPLQKEIKAGVSALKRADKAIISEAERRRIHDSIDLDEAYKKECPGDPRWDYLLSLPSTSKLIGIEPHSFKDSGITEVIRKKEYSRAYLRNHFNEGYFISDWYWVSQGKVRFSDTGSARRKLDQNGIQFGGRHILKFV